MLTLLRYQSKEKKSICSYCILSKIKADIQLGKQSYNQKDLIKLHEILINELIPLDEVQAQINAFADKLKKYLNDL